MNFKSPMTVCHFIETINKNGIITKNVQIDNNENAIVSGLNLVNSIQDKNVVFIDRIKYASKFFKSLFARSAFAIINDDLHSSVRRLLEEKSINYAICDDPFAAFSQIIDIFFMPQKQDPTMLRQVAGAFYYIGNNVTVGKNLQIGMNVVIEDNVTIGNNCRIAHNTVIGRDCYIGDNVIIGDNSTIGGDPFYCKLYDGEYVFMKCAGNVHLQTNVIIGSNCVIERGITSTTLVSKGSAIGHQVIIGHDNIIGESNLILPQAGLSGHVYTGNKVLVRGKAGIDRGITLGNNSVVHGLSAATRDVPDDTNIFGPRGLEQEAYVEQLINIKNLSKFFSDNKNKSDAKHVPNFDFSRMIFEIVNKQLSRNLEFTPHNLELNISNDLFFDSLDVIELIEELEYEFDYKLRISDGEAEIIWSFTINELIEYINDKMNQ